MADVDSTSPSVSAGPSLIPFDPSRAKKPQAPAWHPYPDADLDAAAVALEKARALADILQRAVEGLAPPNTRKNSLWNTIGLLDDEIERAEAALFGEGR